MKITGYDDFYDFFECRLQPPLIDGARLIICIHNIGIMPEHPLNSSDHLLYLKDCQMVFEGVSRSERKVYEYIGDAMLGQFKSEKKVTDGQFPPNKKADLTFRLEGILAKPMAWVDWEVECVSFYLEVPEPPILNDVPV
jgi:hypothetical protein